MTDVVTEVYENVVDVFVDVEGVQGATGPRGASLLTGSGPPDASIGTLGDTYVDVLTGDIYGPRAADGWPPDPLTSITGVQTQSYTVPGSLFVGTGRARFRPNRTVRLLACRASVGVAGSGTGAIVVDLKVNGASVYPSPAERPTIAAGEFDSASTNVAQVVVTPNDSLTIDIAAVPDDFPGADLSVLIDYF